MSFSKVFRGFMVTYCLTIEEVAEQLDRSPSNISRWKNNQKPRQDSLKLLVSYAQNIVLSHEKNKYDDFIENYVMDTIPEYSKIDFHHNEEIVRNDLDRIFSWAHQDMRIIDASHTIEKFNQIYSDNQYDDLILECSDYIKANDNYLSSQQAFEIYLIYAKALTMVSNQNRSEDLFKEAHKYFDRAESSITEVSKEKIFILARYRGLAYGVASNWFDHVENCKKAIMQNEIALSHFDLQKCDIKEYHQTINNMINIHMILSRFEKPTTNKKEAYRYYGLITECEEELDGDTLRNFSLSKLRLLCGLILCDSPEFYYNKIKEAFDKNISNADIIYTSNQKAQMLDIMANACNTYGSLVDSKEDLRIGLNYLKSAITLYDDNFRINKLISNISMTLIQRNLMNESNCDQLLESILFHLHMFDEESKDPKYGSDFREYKFSRIDAEFSSKVRWLYFSDDDDREDCFSDCKRLYDDIQEMVGEESLVSYYNSVLFKVYCNYKNEEGLKKIYSDLKADIESVDPHEHRVRTLESYNFLLNIGDMIEDPEYITDIDKKTMKDVMGLMGMEEIRIKIHLRMNNLFERLKGLYHKRNQKRK